MWEVLRLPAIGNFSFGKITLSFLAVILSVFFWNIATAPTTYAADVQWDGNNLKYQNQTYEPITDSIPDVPSGSQTFAFRQPDQGVAHVIFIPQDADMTQEFDATFRSYNFTPPNTYTNPQAARTVSVDAGGESRPLTTRGFSGEQSGETQCAIQGVGWMICPVSRFLAAGMDKIFDLLKGFLEVRSVTLDTTSPLYRMWEIMRGFANIAFVIAFLIIIYSQVSGVGFSNYNIKKLLPRLIVAALLVNLSYYICAIAVDLSNILGYSLQQAFIDLRGQIVGNNTGANTQVTSWESITTFVISGGTLAVAGVTTLGVAIAGGAGVVSMVFLLLPFLLGVLIAVIVALLVLAARQAIIVVLIAVSPIAFVAYLLPNTEKWFDKWKDLFLTMMLLFPIFSVIFGGSQLAGSLIIQTATDLNIVMLGMFVQVAPIVITPLLVKFSGGLLGRLAGMVNNPSKGIIDRTRGWANEKSDESKKRNQANAIGRRAARMEAGQGKWRRRAHVLDTMRSSKATSEGKRKSRMHTYGEAIDKAAELQAEEVIAGKAGTGALQRRRSSDLRQAHAFTYGQDIAAQALKAEDEREKEEAKAGKSDAHSIYAPYASGIRHAADEQTLENMAAQSAKRVANVQFADKLEKTAALQNQAAGIDTDFGPSRAIATAIETRVNDRSAGLKGIETMIAVKNPSRDQMFELATTNNSSIDGITNNREVREVAIKQIAGGGDVGQIHELAVRMDTLSRDDNNEFWRTAFTDALKGNANRPGEFSMTILENISQAKIPFGQAGLDKALLEAAEANVFDASGIIKNDKDTLERLFAAIQNNPGALSTKGEKNLRSALGKLSDDNYKGTAGKRKQVILDMASHLGVMIDPDNL